MGTDNTTKVRYLKSDFGVAPLNDHWVFNLITDQTPNQEKPMSLRDEVKWLKVEVCNLRKSTNKKIESQTNERFKEQQETQATFQLFAKCLKMQSQEVECYLIRVDRGFGYTRSYGHLPNGCTTPDLDNAEHMAHLGMVLLAKTENYYLYVKSSDMTNLPIRDNGDDD